MRFPCVKLTVLAARPAIHPPGWAGPALPAGVGLVILVSSRAGRRSGGGQVVAGDVVDLDAVGPG